jgi:hypothetical protein
LEHHEIPEDEYIPVPREGRQTSPAYRFFTTDFFTVQVNVDPSGGPHRPQPDRHWLAAVRYH